MPGARERRLHPFSLLVLPTSGHQAHVLNWSNGNCILRGELL